MVRLPNRSLLLSLRIIMMRLRNRSLPLRQAPAGRRIYAGYDNDKGPG